MKTGALISCAVEVGAILGRIAPEGRTGLRGYARDVGLAHARGAVARAAHAAGRHVAQEPGGVLPVVGNAAPPPVEELDGGGPVQRGRHLRPLRAAAVEGVEEDQEPNVHDGPVVDADLLAEEAREQGAEVLAVVEPPGGDAQPEQGADPEAGQGGLARRGRRVAGRHLLFFFFFCAVCLGYLPRSASQPCYACTTPFCGFGQIRGADRRGPS
jgi:hypothetical protein